MGCGIALRFGDRLQDTVPYQKEIPETGVRVFWPPPPPILGSPGPHIAREIGPGEPQISSDMWTRGPDFTSDMGTSERFGDLQNKRSPLQVHVRSKHS